MLDVRLLDDVCCVRDGHVSRCCHFFAAVEVLSSPRQVLWSVKPVQADVDSTLIETLDLQNDAGATYSVTTLHYTYDYRVVDGVLHPVY